MPRIALTIALFLFLVTFSAVARQNYPAPAPPEADAARYREEIRQIEGSLPKFEDRNAALFFLATRYAQLGELPKSLALLKECLASDAGFDPRDMPEFRPLQSDPEFVHLMTLVRRRYSPVHRARVAFTVPETDLFPEGLAVDVGKHVFYMGSMHHNEDHSD